MAEGLYFPAFYTITSIHPCIVGVKPTAASITSGAEGRAPALPRGWDGGRWAVPTLGAHGSPRVPCGYLSMVPSPHNVPCGAITSPAPPLPPPGQGMCLFQLIIQMYSNSALSIKASQWAWADTEGENTVLVIWLVQDGSPVYFLD